MGTQAYLPDPFFPQETVHHYDQVGDISFSPVKIFERSSGLSSRGEIRDKQAKSWGIKIFSACMISEGRARDKVWRNHVIVLGPRSCLLPPPSVFVWPDRHRERQMWAVTHRAC